MAQQADSGCQAGHVNTKEMKIKGISEIGKQIEQQPDISEIEHRFIDFMEKRKNIE